MRYLILFLLLPVILFSQEPRVVSGPFQGHTTSHSTTLWTMVSNADRIQYDFSGTANGLTERITINDSLQIEKIHYSNILFEEDSIIYVTVFNGNRQGEDSVKVKLFQEDISDFSFMAGSCVWYYKKKSKKWNIFKTMKEYPADFMLWMGDNIYLVFGDWKTEEKITNKYIKYRQKKQVNDFLQSQANYTAWDDHDYGPNNADASFKNKDVTLQAFKNFWANPSYGTDSIPGAFYSFKNQDAEFFVLDGRYNKTKETLYGKAQMDWLKNQLRASDARVKFIVGGCQFLVETSFEDWSDHPEEKEDFLQFIQEEKMKGIVFLSGDRHLAELSKLDDGKYPKLLELTSSPLTSFANPGFFYKKKNPLRVEDTLFTKRNFARILLLGKGADRKLRIELRDKKGKLQWDYEVLLDDL